MKGLVADAAWSSWWTTARKNPQVVVHGSGKNASVEWSTSAGAADATLLGKFREGSARRADRPLPEEPQALAGAGRRDGASSRRRGREAGRDEPGPGVRDRRPRREDPGRRAGARRRDARLEKPSLSCRSLRTARMPREGARPRRLAPAGGAPAILHEWFFKEEDGRTIEWMDRALLQLSAGGPRPDARQDPLVAAGRPESLHLVRAEGGGGRGPPRAPERTDPGAPSRRGLVGRARNLRTKVREMFDRTGLAAAWLVKQATLDEARAFLEALSRHNELEKIRRDGLVAAAEMRFPELRTAAADTFFRHAGGDRAEAAGAGPHPEGRDPGEHEGDRDRRAKGPHRELRVQGPAREAAASFGPCRKDPGGADPRRPIDPAAIDGTEIRPGARVTLSVLRAGSPSLSSVLGLEARRGGLLVPFGRREGAAGEDDRRSRRFSRRERRRRDDRTLEVTS